MFLNNQQPPIGDDFAWLTVTKVVFEFRYYITNTKMSKWLTVTKVVFELQFSALDKLHCEWLTVTKVVFEYGK